MGVLVDTSVWIDFLRWGNERLEYLLNDAEVLTHPLVVGELHVGNISRRDEFLGLLGELPCVEECTHVEVLAFIDSNKLYGKGIGYADAHILCSSILAGVELWTFDKRLDRIARVFG